MNAPANFEKNLFLKKYIFLPISELSRVAQRKRAGPITQRSVDRNYALLLFNKNL